MSSKNLAINKKHIKNFFNDVKKNKAFLMMLVPGIILLIAFNYIPMVGVLIAFKRINFSKGFIKSDWVGFKNFEFFIKTPDAFTITRNTVLYNIAFIILGLVLSVFCAIALNEIKNAKFAKFYQSSMFLPYFLSWMVISYLGYSFLSPQYGFMNRVVLKILGRESINWYSNLKAWPFIIICLNLWKYAGYNCVIYLASIIGIDPEFYEAASIDGATRWQQIRKITIPHLVPIMTILTILSVGRIFNADFGLFYQATLQQGNGILKPVTDVIDTYVYNALINIGDLGMASAAGLYQAAIGFVLVVSANFIVKKMDREKSLF